MSFFSNGFASRRKKKDDGAKKGKKEKKEEKKKDTGEWELLTDSVGRTFWRHTVTGDISGGLVSPVSTINPSPIGYPGAVFTPSPVPPVFAPPPAFVVAPPTNEKKKKEKKEEGNKEAYWEEKYDKDGVRYWKHTTTKKITYNDPLW